MKELLMAVLAEPGADAALQQRVLATGLAQRDNALLAALAETPDIDPSIDAALREVPAAVVRSRWIARPGRSSEEVADLVASEKRAGALAALAGIEGLDVSVYERLASAPHARVLAALCANDAVSDVVKRSAMTTWCVKSVHQGSTASAKRRFASTAANDPDTADAVMRLTDSVAVVADVASCDGVTSEALLRCVNDVLATPLEDPVDYREYSSALSALAALLAAPEVDDAVVARAAELLTACRRSGDSPFESNHVKAMTDRVDRLLSDHSMYSEAAARAAAATDPADLASMVAGQSAPFSHSYNRAIALNRYASPATVAVAAKRLGHPGVRRVVSAWSTSPEHVAAIITESPYWLHESSLRTLPDRLEVLNSLAIANVGNWKPLVYRLARFEDLPLETILAMPPERVSYLVECRPRHASPVVEHVRAVLGENDAAWDLLAKLWSGQHGPLGELLESAALLSVEPAA